MELSGALAERGAIGLPLRAVGDGVREVALAFGSRRDFLLGELEALALQRAFGGVRAPAAPFAEGRLLELGDACARFVRDALRLGLGAAGGLKLVDEVLGGAADALAKLREFGLQLNDGRAGDGGLPGARGFDVGWAARALGVERSRARSSSSRQRMAASRRSIGVRSSRRPRAWPGAISVRSRSRSVGVSTMNSTVGSRARDSAVYAQLRVKSSGRPTTPAHSTVPPWMVCAVST